MYIPKCIFFTYDTHQAILLVTFCDTYGESELVFGHTHGRTDGRRTEGQTDVEVEIVI